MRCGGTVWAEDLVSTGVQLALEAEVAQAAVSRTALLYHVHPRRRQYEVVKKRRKAIDECARWWSTVRHSSIRNRDEQTSSGSVALEEEVIHRPGVMCWGFKVLGYLATYFVTCGTAPWTSLCGPHFWQGALVYLLYFLLGE